MIKIKKRRKKKRKSQHDSYQKANSNDKKDLHFAEASINRSVKWSANWQATPAYIYHPSPRPYSIRKRNTFYISI